MNLKNFFKNRIKYINPLFILNNRGTIDFDGIDDEMNLSSASVSAFPISFYCVFKLNSLGTEEEVFSYVNSGTGNQYFMFKGNGSNQWEYQCRAGGNSPGSSNFVQILQGTTDTNYHELVIISRASNDHEVYLDGVSIATSSTNTGFPSSISNIALGGNARSSPDFGNVEISEFAMWSSDITAFVSDLNNQEFLQAQDVDSANLEVYWSLTGVDDGVSADGVVFTDESGNGRDVTGDDGANNTGLLGVEETFMSFPNIIDESETIEISDSLNIFNDKEFITEEETIQLSESSNITIPVLADFATKIISINPLIFVTNTTPAQIVKVDITDPENPIEEASDLVTATNAQDVAFNSVTNFLYVACANGIVVKVDVDDLSSQTIIDLSDTDELEQMEVLSQFGITYAGTNSSTGEAYIIDEREVTKIDTNFNFLSNNTTRLNTRFDLISSSLVDCDFHFLSEQTTAIKCDFKFLPDVDQDPINWDDIHVFLDNVELEDNDVNLRSINFNHPIDEDDKSTVTLTLARKHDDMNTDTNGNSKTITNQNQLRIEVDGNVEFDGQISNINCIYDNGRDAIEITATMKPPTIKFNKVTLSLPSIDENLNKYHIRVHNPVINNDIVSETDQAPSIFKGIRVNLGDITRQSGFRQSSFIEGRALADKIVDGTFQPDQNYRYFWFVRAKLIRPEVTSSSEQIVNDGGDKEKQDGFLAEAFFPTDIFQGFDFTEFEPEFADFNTSLGNLRYIGDSISGIGTDLWQLISAQWKRQRTYEDDIELGVILDEFDSIGESSFLLTETPTNGFHSIELVSINGKELDKDEYTFSGNSVTITNGTISGDRVQIQYGTNDYFVGEAPFDTISVRNGKLIAKEKWEDKEDGFYRVKDESFDFTDFAKRVADLEYQKLLNINGDILPKTSCTISLTLDAYYYYGIKPGTRINIDNTTNQNIFNNNNGFPVSVKSINIDTSNGQNGFMVNLTCNNEKSIKELEELNDKFPDEESDEFNFEGVDSKLYSKFDMANKKDAE